MRKTPTKPQLLVHQQGQHQPADQLQRHIDQGVDGRHLERLPEEGIAGEHLFIVVQPNELGRAQQIPAGETDEQRSDHRPQDKEQKTQQPGRDQEIEGQRLPSGQAKPLPTVSEAVSGMQSRIYCHEATSLLMGGESASPP